MLPANEHAFKETDIAQVYYPDHSPRVETPTFRHTKAEGKKLGDVCAITGQRENIEYHHVFCEDAFTDAVDWQLVKDIATRKVTRIPMIDIETGESIPSVLVDVDSLLIGLIIQITKARGFDWEAFDPAKPETFVDSRANMLPLNVKMHRLAGHGMHHLPLPLWIFQAFPRTPGFVFSADELAARHAKGS